MCGCCTLMPRVQALDAEGRSRWQIRRLEELRAADAEEVAQHKADIDALVGSAGYLPCLAVVAVAGQRPADGDDQAGVGVDDDLVVGGVPVVLRLLGD
ncbi:hypothetical protein GCM10010261_59980 [Streptomyces pilosus]|nr:hypothetical protein GCM10010261_59980 [Streptomyces pilosus]